MFCHLRCALAACTVLLASHAPALESQLPPVILEASSAVTHLYPEEMRLVEVGFDIPLGMDFIPERVEKTCSCVIVESADVQGATWTGGSHHAVTFGFSSGPVIGFMQVPVWILGRVGKDPRCIAFTLLGEVAPYIMWPTGADIIDLGEQRMDELPREFQVPLRKGKNPQPFETISGALSSPDGLFDIRIAPAGTDAWTMFVTIRKLPLSGVITTGITLTCSQAGKECKGHPSNRLRIHLIGPMSAKPTGILFGNVPQGQREVRTITRVGRGVDDIAGITAADRERVTWRFLPGAAPPKLEVTFTGSGLEGPASGHIDIHQKDATVLRIPYVAHVSHGLPALVPSPEKSPKF